MSDARIRELERRATAGDRDALRELGARRARLGQFTCCGRVRPPGLCSLCWHCRKPGEVLVGAAYRKRPPATWPASTAWHIAQLRRDVELGFSWSEDSFARCDSRIRGPGPLHWGMPTCRRCLGIEALPDRGSLLAWEQLVAFARHAPTILYDGTPILVPGLLCPECPNGGIALDVIGWADDGSGEPEDFDVTCSADCDTEEGHGGGSVWLDVMDAAHAWAAKHVRVAVEGLGCGRVGPPDVTCATCRRTKAPTTSTCDDDCPGYRQDPKPSPLWPGERCGPPLCPHGRRP